jgi:8-oxo-dGTP pyrophosphatase MutT (NUDIX family)
MSDYSSDEFSSWLARLERRASSAGVALYDANGRVLIVKAYYKKYWSFPGGIVDVGETPRQAAVRETREEVGLPVHIEKLDFRLIVNRVSDIAQTYQFIFESRVGASVLDHVLIDNKEIESYALVSREDILHGEKVYSASVIEWAKGTLGYIEQDFS